MKLEEKIKSYVSKLKGQEGYFIDDIKTIDYFALNPSNTKLEDIKLKIGMVSDRDLDQAGASESMAKHILDLKIDPRLKANDLDVVEDIAGVEVNGKKMNLLRFASLYCNFHNPDVYPIYSDQHLDMYRNYIAEHKLSVKPEDLVHYKVFKSVLDDVMNRFKVRHQLNYQQVRKLGWLYIDKIFTA